MRTNLLLALANWYKRHKKAHYESQAEYHRVKAATYERCIPDNGEKVTGSLIVAIAHHTANEAKYRSLAKTLVALALLFPVGVIGEPINSHMVTLGNTQATFISSTETLFVDGYDCKVDLVKHTAVCIPTAKPTWRKN